MQISYSILIPLLLGAGIFLLINQKTHSIFNPFISYPLGCGILAAVMFGLATLKIPLDLKNISIAAWLTIFAFAFLLFVKRPKITLKIHRPSLLQALLIILIGLKVLYVFSEAAIKPVFTWDAWSRYAYVAKATFIDQTFLTNSAIQRMEDYPLLAPLNQAWIAICQGFFDDAAIKIFSASMFLSLLSVFYFGLRRMGIEKTKSLFSTFLLSTLPFIVFHSTTAYLDLPMTVYYTAGTIFMVLFIKNKDHKKIIISALFLGFAIWTKRAGIYLSLINTFSLIGFFMIFDKKKLSEIISPFLNYLIIIILIALPWVIYNKTVVSAHYYTAAGVAGELRVDFLARTLNVFAGIADKMFNSANWNLSWLFLALSILFFFQKIKGEKIFMSAVIISNFLALVFVFQFSGAHRFLLDGTLLNRIMMYMMPLVLFFSSCLVFED